MQELMDELLEKQVGTVKLNEPLANHTTWNIGGPADLFIEPNSIEGIRKTMEVIRKHDLPWRAVGRGSNLLVDDRGVEGAVIKLGESLSQLTIEKDRIEVGGGFSFIKLATLISKKGLSGLEFAGGIPGTVGGAVFMNAGAHGSDISNILTEAHVLFPDGQMKWIKNEEMEFSYRTSLLQKEKGICIEARMQLKEGKKEEVVKQMRKNKQYRKDTQPWNLPCAGSVFRNPLPEHAGHLIEKAGLKGLKIGGAQISEQHGNFIVNVNEAKAKDVLAIINHVKKTIKQKYGIEMETEVEIVTRHANDSLL